MKRQKDRRKILLEEHKELGKTLQKLWHQLSDIQECFNITSPTGRLLWQWLSLNGYISDLKCQMDDVVCRDYPGQEPEKVYYGSSVEMEKTGS